MLESVRAHQIAGFASALCLAWGLALAAFGGFDVELLGVRIRSTDPLRPLMWCLLTLSIHILTGDTRIRERWYSLASSMSARLLAGALAALTVVVGIVYNTTTAGGADAYGYVSQADLWIDGSLRISQPWVQQAPWPSRGWTVSPLGYKPDGPEDSGTIVPTYSPGLPLLMAAAKIVAGHEAMFWVVPLCGGVLVLAAYGLGHRLNSPPAGLIGAWLTVTSPPFAYTLMLPWSDVPAAAAWATAFYFLFGQSLLTATVSGLAAATAILIRPNFVWAAGVLGLWFVIRLWRSPSKARRHAAFHGFAFGGAAAVGVVAVALIYDHLYGSPLVSGYGRFTDNFVLARIPANLRQYSTWLWETRAAAFGVGMVAVVIPARQLWPQLPDRLRLLIIALFVAGAWLMYLSYFVYDEWPFLRFLLPAYPLVMVGAGSAALARVKSRGMLLTVAGLVIAVGIFAQFRHVLKSGTVGLVRTERRYAVAGQLTRRMTEPNSIILSMGHSGSARYYAGRTTLRYDLLEPLWLDRALEWLQQRGVHPYLLLEEGEIRSFQTRFAGQRAVRYTYAAPLFRCEGFGTVVLYDLGRERGGSTERFVATIEGTRAMPPAPPQALERK